jgi:hypothetical protein
MSGAISVVRPYACVSWTGTTIRLYFYLLCITKGLLMGHSGRTCVSINTVSRQSVVGEGVYWPHQYNCSWHAVHGYRYFWPLFLKDIHRPPLFVHWTLQLCGVCSCIDVAYIRYPTWLCDVRLFQITVDCISPRYREGESCNVKLALQSYSRYVWTFKFSLYQTLNSRQLCFHILKICYIRCVRVAPRLRMSGAIPLVPLYVNKVQTGVVSP